MGLTNLLNRTTDRLNRFVEQGEAARTPSPRPPRVRSGTPSRYHKRDARPLEADDVDAFLLASGEFYSEQRREKMKPPTSTSQERDDFIKQLGRRYPNRIRRIGHDFDWLRKQARRHGINPEEVRWLL